MTPTALGGVEPQAQPHPFTPVPVDHGVTGTGMPRHLRDVALDIPDVARFTRRKDEGGLVVPELVALAARRSLALPTLAFGASCPTDAVAAQLIRAALRRPSRRAPGTLGQLRDGGTARKKHPRRATIVQR